MSNRYEVTIQRKLIIYAESEDAAKDKAVAAIVRSAACSRAFR